MGQITVLHFSLIAGVLVTALLIGHLLRQRRSPAATLKLKGPGSHCFQNSASQPLFSLPRITRRGLKVVREVILAFVKADAAEQRKHRV